jgi:hypothetical protein
VAISAGGGFEPLASPLHPSAGAAAASDAQPARQQPGSTSHLMLFSWTTTRSLLVWISSATTQWRWPVGDTRLASGETTSRQPAHAAWSFTEIHEADTHAHLCTPPGCACLAVRLLHHCCKPAAWLPQADPPSWETLW